MNTVTKTKVEKIVKITIQEVVKSVLLGLRSLSNSDIRQPFVFSRTESFAPESISPELEKNIASIEAEVKIGKISKPTDDLEDFLRDLKDDK